MKAGRRRTVAGRVEGGPDVWWLLLGTGMLEAERKSFYNATGQRVHSRQEDGQGAIIQLTYPITRFDAYNPERPPSHSPSRRSHPSPNPSCL